MPRFKLRIIMLLFGTLLLISGWMPQEGFAQAQGRVTVAKSGGDYTTIGAALAAITPTQTNPFVIDVMPGIYAENITMKAYVHLRGAGRNTVMIRPNSGPVITVPNSGPVKISNVTITTFASSGTGVSAPTTAALEISDSSIIGVTTGLDIGGGTVEDNIISPWTNGVGININNQGSPTIRRNEISGGGNANYGIVASSGAPIITENKIISFRFDGVQTCPSGNNTGLKTVISDNIIAFNGTGISDCSTTPHLVVSGNYMTGNTTGISISNSGPDLKILRNTITESTAYGIRFFSGSTSPSQVTHNRITGTGTANIDIGLDFGTVNVSFNIYDTSSGSGTKVGSYNVKSDGTPIN